MSSTEQNVRIPFTLQELDQYIPRRANARWVNDCYLVLEGRCVEAELTVEPRHCIGCEIDGEPAFPQEHYVPLFAQATAALAGHELRFRWGGRLKHYRVTPGKVARPGDKLTVRIESLSTARGIDQPLQLTGRGVILNQDGVLVAECDGVVLLPSSRGEQCA